MNNDWIDLTHVVGESTLVYPGDPSVQIITSQPRTQDDFSLATLHSAMHVGTHIDAMSHYLKDGTTIEQLDVSLFIGQATVLHPQRCKILKTSELERLYLASASPSQRLLVDTSHHPLFGKKEYFSDLCLFEDDFGDFLKRHKILLFGVDMPTVQFVHGGAREAHKAILSQGIPIIEGLSSLEKLYDVVDFVALPLALEKFDGSYTRAVARNHFRDIR